MLSNKDSNISNPLPQTKNFKIQYNVTVPKLKTIATVLLHNIRRDISDCDFADSKNLQDQLHGLYMTSKCNITSRKPDIISFPLDDMHSTHMQCVSQTDIVIDDESSKVACGRLCVPINHAGKSNAQVLTNVKCLLAEYHNSLLQETLSVSVLMTPIPENVKNPYAKATLSSPEQKRSFFVSEKYICKNNKVIHMPTNNKLRYVKENGLLSPNILPVHAKCLREEKLSETRQDHREFLRSLGCSQMFTKNSTSKKITGNIISWTTHDGDAEPDAVRVISVFVPIFW